MEQKVLLGTIVTLLFLMALAIAGPATADTLPPPPPGMGERPNGPPPEAFTACEGKKAGDAVTVTTPRGDLIKAVCEILDSRLVAKPINAQQPMKPKE
ncbi:MAG: hypothetical protein V2B20_07170 [Pseudomonadota bacterium]